MTMNRSCIQFLWLLPLALSLAVNAGALQNGFGWDDRLIIENIQAPESVRSLFLPHTEAAARPHSTAPYYRPMVGLSFLLDKAIWDDTPFGFHLSVWLLNGLNTLLVFFLTKRWMTVPPDESPQQPIDVSRLTSHVMPLIAASLFAVHPIHAEAVAWIAGRNDVLCATFLLTALLLYTFSSRLLFFTLSMLAFFCALLTKEAAVFAFVLFPLYDYFSEDGRANPASRIPHLASRTIPPLLTVAVYFAMRAGRLASPAGGASAGTFLSADSIATALAAVGLYFKLLIWPYPHHPFIAEIPKTPGLIAVSVFLLGVAVIVWGFSLHRSVRLIAMASGLMLLTLLPAVLVAVLNVASNPAAERYLYLPSAGFVMLVAWAAGQEWERRAAGGSGGVVRIAGAVLVFGLLTVGGWQSWERIPVWHDLVSFWEAAAAGAPNAGFPAGQLGVQMERHGMRERAETLYRRAIALDEASLGPDHPFVAINLQNLADLDFDRKRFAEAESLYRRAIAIREKSLGPEHPELAITLNNLGALYRVQGRYAEAEPLYRRALAIREKAFGPDHFAVFTSLNNLAVLYHVQGRYEAAETYYRRALATAEKAVRPDDPNLVRTLESYENLLRRMKRDAEADAIRKRADALRGGPAR
jgi:tetratricopeptide (TPR) repeat protein